MASPVDLSSDGDSEISESEMDEYEDKSYEKLQKGSHNVKVAEGTFTCPYCPQKRKRDYQYTELVQHASGVGNSNKRSVKEKANHLALRKYLEKDLTTIDGPSKPAGDGDPLDSCDQNEKIAWPWAGVVVNIPTRRTQDGKYAGESGSKYRDELISRGFNPTRVVPLWNFRGHSGSAIVEFNKDWTGLHNALSFEKAYEAEHHGKKDWCAASGNIKSGLYAWVARADDYNGKDLAGEHLRKTRDLKTISEMMEEEARKQERLVSNLKTIIEVRSQDIKEMEQRCKETTISINNVIIDKEKLLQSYNEEIRQLQQRAQDHFQRIFSDHEKLKEQIESHKKDLESRRTELEKREVKNDNERKVLSEEIEQNASTNTMLEQATLEQLKYDETVMQLAEDHKMQKETLHNKIIQLEKQLNAKQTLELEIEQMRGNVSVMEHMASDGDIETLKKIDLVLKDVREKEAELEDLNAEYQTLLIKERQSNEELQDARKEIINCLKETPGRSHIGVRRMGELNTKPFHEAMRRRCSEEEAEVRASELCSLWQEYLKDPGWHPFKIVKVEEEKHKRVIDEENERLSSLRNDLGEEVYKSVTDALVEIAEYNPSGGYITAELWNYKENKKATLKEGIKVLLNQWRIAKYNN